MMYIDIDVHHGDGVERAFYSTDMVMTVSFHKYDEINFFHWTGHIMDVGVGLGNNYAVNVPLQDEIDDQSYNHLFTTVVQKATEVCNPGAIVLHSGADSFGGDRLGPFNLTVRSHIDCLCFLKHFNIHLMVLGGGGYTVRNVARCWCFERAVAVGVDD
ncbi:unnamed protein product [Linum trigynum]|uniref:Histone deacetylase domain-containing protein n=1 Tax=Linum trigynum TaxID=586398 RepID=A0AAV2GFY5_9ROSI